MKKLLLITLLFGSCSQMERPNKPFIIHDKRYNKKDTLIIEYGVYDLKGKYLYFEGRRGDYQIGDTIH